MLQVLFSQFGSDAHTGETVPQDNSGAQHRNYDDDVQGLMQAWTALLRGC